MTKKIYFAGYYPCYPYTQRNLVIIGIVIYKNKQNGELSCMAKIMEVGIKKGRRV